MTLRDLINFVDSEQYSDNLTYVIEVAPDLNISKVQLLDAILQEMSKGGFSEDEESAFWDDFDNLQKTKIIR